MVLQKQLAWALFVVVINIRVFSANITDFGLFCFISYFQFTPPPPFPSSESQYDHERLNGHTAPFTFGIWGKVGLVFVWFLPWFLVFVIACFFFVCLEFQIFRFVISTFMPMFFLATFPSDAVLQKRLARALFVLLLSTLLCYQPTELIWAFFLS